MTKIQAIGIERCGCEDATMVSLLACRENKERELMQPKTQ